MDVGRRRDSWANWMSSKFSTVPLPLHVPQKQHGGAQVEAMYVMGVHQSWGSLSLGIWIFWSVTILNFFPEGYPVSIFHGCSLYKHPCKTVWNQTRASASPYRYRKKWQTYGELSPNTGISHKVVSTSIFIAALSHSKQLEIYKVYKIKAINVLDSLYMLVYDRMCNPNKERELVYLFFKFHFLEPKFIHIMNEKYENKNWYTIASR